MIGLTPLIDVVFILLIFFMLVVQFEVYQQMPLATTEATTLPVEQTSETVVITVRGEDSCHMGDITLPCEAIIALLETSAVERVYLAYEPGASLDEIIKVHDAVIMSGHDVSLALLSQEAGHE